MNDIQIFNNSEFGEIRTLEENGKVLFCGADIAKALGYSNARDALLRHCKRDGVVKHDIIDNMGRTQQAKFITEGNVYRLTAHSKLPTAERFESWVFDEVLPTIRKTGSYTAKPVHTAEDKTKALEIKMKNARVRTANMWLKISSIATLSEEYKNICAVKAANELAGTEMLALPKSEQKTYSAGEVGEMFGVSAQKIGHIAKTNNLKTDEYGSWYRDKSPYSTKEIDTFRYNDKAVEKFRELFK